MQIELCIESELAAKVAQEYKVDRIEVCSDLAADGLTPGIELLEKCRNAFSGEVYAMIRPRPGDFCYSNYEITEMQSKISEAAEYGANGVVIGALDKNMDIDMEGCSKLTRTAASLNLDVTFHRAFDVCNDPLNSLEKVIGLSCKRILTSGQKPVAGQGIDLISKLCCKSAKRIEIMAGSGLSPQNAGLLIEAGVDALHFSIHNKNLSPVDPGYILRDKIEGILSKI